MNAAPSTFTDTLRRAGAFGLAAWVVAALALAHGVYCAYDQDTTRDERVHIEWSRRLLQGIDERESVARFESKTPVSLPSVLLIRTAEAAGIVDWRRHLFAGRLATVAATALLLAAVYGLTRRLWPAPAPSLAVVATALDPSVVGNGTLITADVPYALGVVLTAWAALRFAAVPRLASAVLLGAALGLALVAKFSGVLLVLALLLLPVLGPRRAPGDGRAPRRLIFLYVALVPAVSAAVLCAAYLFHNVGVPLGDLTLGSKPFTFLARTFPGLRLPLPAAFLTGIDHTMVRESGWPVYLFGRLHTEGVWYYFPVHWLLKTPLMLLLATAAGLGAAAWTGSLLRQPGPRFVAAVLALHLAYFSFVFDAQIGYRFVLMGVPLAYALAAGAVVRCTSSRLRVVAAGALLFTLVENAAYWGNPLAFTNAAVWPKESVWRLIADSSVHYGQDRDRIRRWLLQSGAADSQLDPLHVVPGHMTIDSNLLAGITDPERYRWLRENLPPTGHVGYTHLSWDISEADFGRFLDEKRRVETSASAAAACEALALERYPPGARIALRLDEPPGRIRSFVVCASVAKTTDLAFKVQSGIVRFGVDRSGECRTETLTDGDVSWYRLEPGVHRFCLQEVPNARAFLPYSLEGSWRAPGRSVSLAWAEEAPSAP